MLAHRRLQRAEKSSLSSLQSRQRDILVLYGLSPPPHCATVTSLFDPFSLVLQRGEMLTSHLTLQVTSTSANCELMNALANATLDAIEL
jgi:hypothetical protein